MSKQPIFLDNDFLLQTPMARRLYHDVAAGLPIIDYHNHLPPSDIATNRRFQDLAEIWLEGDHYKWRAMRADGVDERLCTGDAGPYEKFEAWSATVPHTLRNPLYHWTHLELKRYFGINELLNAASAKRVWEASNARLQDPDRDVHGILASFNVEVLCTTDDPADDLGLHRQIREAKLKTRVFPTFRPDALMRIDDAASFLPYVQRLGQSADVEIGNLDDLRAALATRHAVFDAAGCRASDHGLNCAPGRFLDDRGIAGILETALQGAGISAEDAEAFRAWVLVETGRMNAEKGWAMQLHVGAMRNNSTRMFKALGRDTGFDSIGDWGQVEPISRLLDRLDCDGLLPKTVLYNLNPADNYAMAAVAGNFQDGSMAGKIQYGSGWWFLDQLEGMTWQMNALSNVGLLYRFVGMLTDSRSFMSFPRHEYFRRLLCNLLGNDVDAGMIPNDFDLIADLVRNVCHENARAYFQFPE